MWITRIRERSLALDRRPVAHYTKLTSGREHRLCLHVQNLMIEGFEPNMFQEVVEQTITHSA
jgi:hypothetical protein